MGDILYPLRKLHGNLFERRKQHEQLKNVLKRIKNTPQNTTLFVLTPTHGNLGDHAIAEATEELLEDIKMPFTEVTASELALLSKYHRMRAMNGYPIVVNGGGNLGTLWPGVEKLFREIIANSPESPIVCLPNTIYYEPTPEGQKELDKSKRIYNAHHKLLLCAREKISYESMKAHYNNVILVPDMALSLNKCNEAVRRDGCMLCLRDDIERTRTEYEAQVIHEQVRELFGDRVWNSDMNIRKTVPVNCRKNVLEQKYSEFRTAELVITDRLHGMIFAAITGTPCLVVNSKSPKVKGCYQWIEELGYIRFLADPIEIESAYADIKGKDYTYCNEQLEPYFGMLKEKLRQFLVVSD